MNSSKIKLISEISAKKQAISVLLVSVMILLATADSFSAKWILFPSFDRNPVRIMDTEDETFFLVHQQVYDKNMSAGYEFPTLALFHYSKDDSTAGIQPLSTKVMLSSSDIRVADYDPFLESLFVGHVNGCIDIINKDKRKIVVDQLKKSNYPGMNRINAYSFDPTTSEVWVATDAGYLRIDGFTGEILESNHIGLKVERIFGVKDRIIAQVGGKLYEGKKSIRGQEELKLIEGIGNIVAILPINEVSFYYLSGNVGSTHGIYVANIDNGNIISTKLGEDNFTYVPSQSVVANSFESNIIPNRDGYLLFSASKAWHLKVGNEPRAYSIALDETSPGVLGSWDMNCFWTYRSRGKFIKRRAEYEMSETESFYSPSWSDSEDAIRPNAPASFLCEFMTYSERYGLLTQQHGCDWNYNYYTRVNPLLLSGLQNGRWKVYSQSYDMPYVVASDASLLPRYNAGINWFPMADPQGITIDTLNPDYVWCGSIWSGVGRFDLSDIRRNSIRFAGPVDRFADLPCYHVLTSNQNWDTFSCFAPPSIDSEDTLWTMLFDYRSNINKGPGLMLYYLTASERQKIAESESEADVEWGILTLPVYESLNMTGRVEALKHQSNRNKVLVFPSIYSGYFLLYNHKGTLEDASDDEIQKLRYFVTQDGAKFQLSMFYDMKENPETGEIFVSTDSRAFVFNPNDKVENETIKVRLLGLKGGSTSDIYPESNAINRLMFDTEGRLWIATANQGVIGVSKDFREVIARYNTENSPIPSNFAYGLGWNPVEKGLLISTNRGMAMVKPDIADTDSSSLSPYIYPKAIAPDYNGVLWIRNLSPNTSIEVVDDKGNIVKRLISGTAEEISWDLTDNEGSPLRAGLYELRTSDGSVISLPVLTAIK